MYPVKPSKPRGRAGSICIICYPYASRLEGGRGEDRYLFELLTGLRSKTVATSIGETLGPRAGTWKFLAETCRFFLQAIVARGTVYHAADPLGAVPMIMFRKRPLAVTIHDSIPFAVPPVAGSDRYRLRFAVTRLIVRLCLDKADTIVVPFDSTRADMGRVSPSALPKIRVVHYGLTSPASEPQNVRTRPSRSDAAGSEGGRLLFIGGGQPIARGGAIALELLAALKRDHVPGTLVFVGNGSEMRTIQRDVERLGVADRITVVPWIPEKSLLEFMGGFDAFLYPSSFGFSFLALQSMMSGTPLLASDDRDMPEFVAEFGVTCPRRDIECFVTNAKSILLDPQVRESLSKKALLRASMFSSETMIANMMREYESLGTSATSQIRS